MIKESISRMNVEHNDWLTGLDFYKEELASLKGKLTEIAGKYTSSEVAAQVEHFENQFKIQGEHIDTLRHGINENLSKLAAEAQGNIAGYVETELVNSLNNKKELYNDTEKVINELRQEFNHFAAKWM